MKRTKIQKVGIYILSRYGKEAGTIELNKLFYLVDVSFYRLFGEKLSGVSYIRAEKGPYSREISRELCALEGNEIRRETKSSRGVSQFPKIAWSVNGETELELDLKREEKETIDQVVRKVIDLTPMQLEKLAYSTEPMQAILRQEKESQCPLLQESLDFDTIERDKFMQEFLINLKSPLTPQEKECVKHAQSEWAEIESMLRTR